MDFDYRGVEHLLEEDDEEWQSYLKLRRGVYKDLVQENLQNNIVSEANWMLRGHSIQSGEDIGINVHVGDIVYMDYGQAYLTETGYQHFGLVFSVCRKKAAVIPMTSNIHQFTKAYDDDVNPEGRKHLMRLGKLPGMNKPSVLFINDLKFINTARVIDVKAHLDPDSALFRQIRLRVMQVLFDKESG